MLQVHIVTESRPSAVHRLRRLLGIGAVAGPDRNADAEFTDALFLRARWNDVLAAISLEAVDRAIA